jgi:predicted dehydrogenase
MKQVLMQKGEIIIEEVPAPAISENEVLVRTHFSLISTGTELSAVSTSKESILTRALHQPHNVKKAMKMASERGILATFKIINGMLNFGTPTGYSLAGEVVEVGSRITDLKKGDLVACGGANVANHAEFNAVPRLLLTKIPQGLDLRQAASVTLGAIAMQGVRRADPTFGETVAVIGLGLIGQLTCQILSSAGCRVIGIDINKDRLALAKKLGTKHALEASKMAEIKQITDGFGVDSTIITASTESDEPLNQAMEITRKKGTVVVVGSVGLNLKRNPWYEKEIDLRISCSYGPGRYDSSYEDEGLDYPLPYVRWTENRNMEEYVKLLAEGKVNFLALEPKTFALDSAEKAYETLQNERPLAMLFSYDAPPTHNNEKFVINPTKHAIEDAISIALVGAGAFASTMHLPNINKLKKLIHLHAVVSKKGTTAKQLAKRFGANYCTTSFDEVLKDEKIDAVLIATRHILHSRMALKALKAGKHVFVEKPLALNDEELNEFKKFYEAFSSSPTPNPKPLPLLFVGFNRRFSPAAREIKKLIANRKNPLVMTYRVNAGYLSPDHWTQTLAGGGRVIGEACHFLDLFEYFTGSKPTKIQAASINPTSKTIMAQDNFSATIKFADGSVCTLTYTALGNKNFPKEYAEIYCDGRVHVINDYRNRFFGQDKGHLAEMEAFAKAVKSGEAPIPLAEIFSVTETSFAINKLVTNE